MMCVFLRRFPTLYESSNVQKLIRSIQNFGYHSIAFIFNYF